MVKGIKYWKREYVKDPYFPTIKSLREEISIIRFQIREEGFPKTAGMKQIKGIQRAIKERRKLKKEML